MSIRELARLADGAANPTQQGNFADFDLLFEQLAKPPVFSLGFPLPSDDHLPAHRAARCHAAHNQRLLGDEPG